MTSRGERFVDLHMHSTASDGALAPAAVVEAARLASLEVIALTDHDTMTGVAEAQDAGQKLGVRVIAGVELSAVEGNVETHLLGLHIESSEELESTLEELRQQRLARSERMVDRLNELGIPVTHEAVLAESAGGAVGRPHVARALVAGGWVKDHREAFDRYIGAGRPAFVQKERLTVADAVRLVHRAGGLAIPAHPGPGGTRERVGQWVEAGIDGLEVLHPGHSPEDIARLRTLTDHFGLVPSGGSDWHGHSDGARSLGGMRVPLEWLDRQEARVAERARGGMVA